MQNNIASVVLLAVVICMVIFIALAVTATNRQARQMPTGGLLFISIFIIMAMLSGVGVWHIVEKLTKIQ